MPGLNFATPLDHWKDFISVILAVYRPASGLPGGSMCGTHIEPFGAVQMPECINIIVTSWLRIPPGNVLANLYLSRMRQTSRSNQSREASEH
eukprot:349801-Chlamydomonas_euryale.AAC.11